MKKLRTKYNKTRWSSKFISLAIILGVAVAISYSAGWDILITALVTVGLAVAFHFLIATTSRVMVGIVLLMQIATMWPVFTIYANFVGTSMLDGAYIYSIFIVALATIIIAVLAQRYSVGQVWLTMLLAFLGLDIIGPLVMAILETPSVLPGLIISFLILGARCVLWRDVIRKRSKHIPVGLKKEKSEEAVKSLLTSVENVEIIDSNDSPIDFIAQVGNKSYYINTVHLDQRIIVGDTVASGRFNLNSTLYRTAELAESMEKSKKRKKRGEVIPCIVNAADKNNSKLELKVELKGNKRGVGKNVLILSPTALVKMIKKDTKGAPEKSEKQVSEVV